MSKEISASGNRDHEAVTDLKLRIVRLETTLKCITAVAAMLLAALGIQNAFLIPNRINTAVEEELSAIEEELAEAYGDRIEVLDQYLASLRNNPIYMPPVSRRVGQIYSVERAAKIEANMRINKLVGARGGTYYVILETRKHGTQEFHQAGMMRVSATTTTDKTIDRLPIELRAGYDYRFVEAVPGPEFNGPSAAIAKNHWPLPGVISVHIEESLVRDLNEAANLLAAL